MAKEQLYRHGDVLIASLKAVPKGARKKPGGTLAHGEVTGHSHQVQTPGTAELYEDGKSLYLDVVAESATIVHEEHKAITLARGAYRVWRQREYTPSEIRTIQD